MFESDRPLLERAISIDNLQFAWNEVAENNGAGGVDNVSIKKWRRTWEERLYQLNREVSSNRYKPQPLRVRHIPKKNPNEFRTLRIPTITDRVLQRAVLEVLYPIFEAKFLSCSFGYRPGRGLQDAVRHIHQLRKQGYVWVLDADIDDYFHQVDEEILLDFLREDLPDSSLMPLIKQWLAIGRPDRTLRKGVPMGSPISPLFANVYLHRLDQALIDEGFKIVRYADDFIVCCASERELEIAYGRVAERLAELNLIYEPSKTHKTSFEAGFEFIGVHFEESWHWYEWEGKKVEVTEDNLDFLFHQYGPDYG